MENMSNGLSHLFMTVFLHCFSAFMVIPAITDITMSALCPGKDECSIAIYLTGIQQAADVVPESHRASVFGVLSGIASSAFVCGNLSTRFLSTASTFQVAAAVAVIALVYTRMFLPEPLIKEQISTKGTDTICLLEKAPNKKFQLFKTSPSFNDVLCLLSNSSTFLHAAIVSFFVNVAQVGLESSLLAQFHFNKDQFADLLIISGIAGSISQVPYASALISVMSIFAMPCLKSMASKQVGPNEQGKVQGCITGICSFASMVSPLIFSPLTALFLSEHAPFHFPGFGLACAAFALMVAFIESFMINSAIPVTDCSLNNSESAEP
ncbi:putative plastocyanin, chloroplastic-like [Capsicum annuum]|nr:putative plastocyanin, chloroplastic-like [Capsicum annuum]